MTVLYLAVGIASVVTAALVTDAWRGYRFPQWLDNLLIGLGWVAVTFIIIAVLLLAPLE